MKKLLSIVSNEKQNLVESVSECGGMPQPSLTTSTPPVSMNVSMSAQGVDQIKELLNLMNNTTSAPAPVQSEPIQTSLPVIKPAEPEMGDLIKIASEPKEEEFANEPDEEYGELGDAFPSGDDLHREKKQYAKAQDGDNAMSVESIRAQLDARYKEIKEGFDADAKPGDTFKSGKGIATKTKTGLVHKSTGAYGGSEEKPAEDEDDKPTKKSNKK